MGKRYAEADTVKCKIFCSRIKKGGCLMKKNIGIIIFSIISILLVFFIGSRYHFSYSSICGTGIKALKISGLIGGVILTSMLVYEFLWNKKMKNNCSNCQANMQEAWDICPYCGMERMDGR